MDREQFDEPVLEHVRTPEPQDTRGAQVQSRVISSGVNVERELARKVDRKSEADSREHGPLDVRRKPKRQPEIASVG